jgi:AcrR family transcriptional regulator
VTTKNRARPLPADQRRDGIARAAVPLVRQQGRAVTTKEIAAAAGVSEGTLFHVFPDKDAIIAAVVELELRPERVLAALRAIDPAGDLHQRLVSIVEVLRRRLTGVFELMTTLGMRHPPEPTDHEQENCQHKPRHRYGPQQQELLAVISAALAPDAGRLRYPPEQTASLIRLFTFAASHPAITDHNPLPADLIADVLLNGITHPHARDLVGASTTSALGDAPC